MPQLNFSFSLLALFPVAKQQTKFITFFGDQSISVFSFRSGNKISLTFKPNQTKPNLPQTVPLRFSIVILAQRSDAIDGFFSLMIQSTGKNVE